MSHSVVRSRESRPARAWVRRMVGLSICVTQVGCASQPDSIEPSYISPVTYASWSCDQLLDERIRLTKEVERVSGQQRENANADAVMMTVGIVLLWPVLFGLAATKDRKIELGRLKGEYDAVQNNLTSKQCQATPPKGVAMATLAAAEGVYSGKGKTDAWCHTHSMSLTIRGTTVAGTFSEVSSGERTGNVTGTIDGSGTVQVDFQGNNPEYFTGHAEGTLRNGVLNLLLRTKGGRGCGYSFELSKTAS